MNRVAEGRAVNERSEVNESRAEQPNYSTCLR